MTDKAPLVIILAGPNGAGKSTAAPSLLHGSFAVTEFVNADVIARGLSAFDPDAAALDAGRIMLERIEKLTEARESFAFETTLASRTFAPRISSLKAMGYQFYLFYFWLPNSETAVQRVHLRVRSGGHSVPDETVRRRYGRSITNLMQLYIPLADLWRVYNSAVPSGGSSIIATGEIHHETIVDAERWTIIEGAGRADRP